MWLNYSFGIKPLLSDISNADKAISDWFSRTDRSIPVYGSSERAWTFSRQDTNMNGPIGCTWTYLFSYECKLRYRYKGAFAINMRSSNNYGVVDHFGLNLRSVPSTLYELTAFSWMLDYFTTCGSYLEDTFSCPPGVLKYLVANRIYECGMTQGGSIVISKDYRLYGGASCSSGSGSYYSMTRTPLGSIPTVALRFKTIDEVGRNANNRLLNLLSILGTGLKR
jgi:hypothetical protein